MPLISQVGRRHTKVRITLFLITGVLWLGVVIHLFPVWFSFITSIKSTWETFRVPPTLWAIEPTTLAYRAILLYPEWVPGSSGLLSAWVYLKNSFILCGGVIALQIPITALAAYSVSKLHTPTLSRLLFLFFISTLLIPYQISFVPLFLLLKNFPFAFKSIPNIPFTNISFPHYNFLNTYWAVIFPALFSGFNFLLLKGHFDSIPDSLINAARLDGASEVGIFSRIILPLSKPVFAVVAYFTFSGVWNQFMWPLVVLTEEKMLPFSIYMYRLQSWVGSLGGEAGRLRSMDLELPPMDWNAVMAASIIQSIPVFIAFIIFREQLMKGIKLRGFK